MRTHTEEKPCKCQECGVGFSQNGNIKSHIHCHTGEKPYKCQEYGARFSQNNHLKYIKHKHTREKPYTVQRCAAQFSQNNVQMCKLWSRIVTKKLSESIFEHSYWGEVIQMPRVQNRIGTVQSLPIPHWQA